ncbi:glucosidase [Thiocapsa imhoffii]|uniref:Glucosidase n=1 Tax=Thiocapsa imhoffii TaxID=382777 RepID=A0A9X0WKZ9_9GAMM|nr:glucosidase [Thiocapsa imhoffii]MBK1646451.1 glucosidase [Thiocapsa imhoffii]
MNNAEHARLADETPDHPSDWKIIGPYLSERAWGTVREDYSAGGNAWAYFPHDQARSRAYRWSEDGLAGICDRDQYLCFALAFWNHQDAFLKERLFGLSGPEGNHGEDVKEYWWYTDGTPTASWLAWRYHYPQAAFPYQRLRDEAACRGRHDPEFELGDTGIFDEGRYWQIIAEYAKASPFDLCVRIEVHNAGPDAATLEVLPTLWFRNRWSWGENEQRPVIVAGPVADASLQVMADDPHGGRWILTAGASPDGTLPEPLFCENETNTARLFGSTNSPLYPKDGINDHIVAGAATVNPEQRGSKMAFRYRLQIGAGESVELRLRLSRDSAEGSVDLGTGFTGTMAARRREADEFYETLRPEDASAEEAAVMREAFAGMVWSQQFYHFDVARWLAGDPSQPPPPATRHSGRNAGWQHLDAHDVIAMPDKWEYPWFAAWDLAFHCVVLAHIDPAASKHQLLLLGRAWYMHPNGQLPAYEWAFGDVNPPVQAWAALAVFRIDGSQDFNFLGRMFHKLLLNFTWWVNRKDASGDNVFEGGFLGLDNIEPFDRSATLSDGALLEQSDGTAWMAKYCLNMLEMALRLANHDASYEDIALKFFEHFAAIAEAMGRLWDEQDGFFYDRLRHPDGTIKTIRSRSMVGLLPIFAAVELPAALWQRLPNFRKRARWFIDHHPELTAFLHFYKTGRFPEVICLVDETRLQRVLARMLDETEFLSPYGLRSLSRFHHEHPLILQMDGSELRLDYEPGESQTTLFGGNSNWRGPIWFPLNFLAIESLRHLHQSLGERFRVELPTGSGRMAHLGEVADEIERRLLSIFLRDANGERPVFGARKPFLGDPNWSDRILFYEYFHGETGAGLGASHQCGWTSLIAANIVGRKARS